MPHEYTVPIGPALRLLDKETQIMVQDQEGRALEIVGHHLNAASETWVISVTIPFNPETDD